MHKEITAFVSKDKCVWVKDIEITGYDDYMPMLTLNFGKEIEPNIFTRLDGECKTVYYCFTNDYEKYIKLAKEEIKKDIYENIQTLNGRINNLKESLFNIENN